MEKITSYFHSNGGVVVSRNNVRTEDEKRSKRLLRLVIAVCQMNGIALLSPLWFGFSSNFVAASLLMELPPRREQTLRQLQILRYYQPSNVHCQRSTEDKKMYIKNISNFNVPSLRRSRRRADGWRRVSRKLIVGKKYCKDYCYHEEAAPRDERANGISSAVSGTRTWSTSKSHSR